MLDCREIKFKIVKMKVGSIRYRIDVTYVYKINKRKQVTIQIEWNPCLKRKRGINSKYGIRVLMTINYKLNFPLLNFILSPISKHDFVYYNAIYAVMYLNFICECLAPYMSRDTLLSFVYEFRVSLPIRFEENVTSHT